MEIPDFAGMVRERLANPPTEPHPGDDEMAAAFVNVVQKQFGFRDEDSGFPPGLVRMSSLGKCARALGYKMRNVPADGRTIDARARATFAFGDIIELLLLYLLRDAVKGTGWRLEHSRLDGGEQLEVELDMPHTFRLVGHPDGLLVHDSGFTVVVEAKSVTQYAQREWESNDERTGEIWTRDEGYWWQLQAYLHGVQAPAGYVLAWAKEAGVIFGGDVYFDDGYLDDLSLHLADAAVQEPRTLPNGVVLGPVPKLSKATGKPLKGHNKLPWQCRYCSHYRVCWGDRLIETVERDYRGNPSLGLYLKGHK